MNVSILARRRWSSPPGGWRLIAPALLLTAAQVTPGRVAAQDTPSVTPRPPVVLTEQAIRLHRSAIVFDGHNDLPFALGELGNPGFDKLNIARPAPQLQTDIPRLRAGGVKSQFWSVYVSVDTQRTGQSLQRTLEQIALVRTMIDHYPDTFVFCTSTADIQAAVADGKIASLIGVEGGHSIENSLSVLEKLYELGARYMTLTHSATLDWADASTDQGRHGGLTEFGEQVVSRMNDLGMLVDLSHVSEETMRDALRVTRSPVIFSHSSARAICDHPRNVPDDILPLVKANGGVIMVNFFSGFIVPTASDRYRDLQDQIAQWRLQGLDDVAIGDKAAAWDKTHRPERGSIHDVVDHIDHLVRFAGIDCVGLGSDFDGIGTVPEQLEDVSMYPMITQELLNRGYRDDDIRKILGGNVMRVLAAAEAVAAR